MEEIVKDERNLIEVAKFAKLKGVSPRAVYQHIDDNRIEHVFDGTQIMIDLDKYKDYKFRKVRYKYRGENPQFKV